MQPLGAIRGCNLPEVHYIFRKRFNYLSNWMGGVEISYLYLSKGMWFWTLHRKCEGGNLREAIWGGNLVEAIWGCKLPEVHYIFRKRLNYLSIKLNGRCWNFIFVLIKRYVFLSIAEKYLSKGMCFWYMVSRCVDFYEGHFLKLTSVSAIMLNPVRHGCH